MNLESPAGSPRRGIFLFLAVAAAFVAGVALVAHFRRSNSGAAPPERRFPGHAGWEPTSEGEFEERSADFSGSRLRLRAATRNTPSDSVKFLGMRRREEIRLGEGTRVSVDLDWNRQANGSGLSAGIVLAPAATSGNPLDTPSFLQIEYIGVPPGKNARLVVAARDAGRHRTLHDEGWPDANREGRPIGVQRIEILFGKDGAFRVLENGREVMASEPRALSFGQAYLYCQMSSRSNYPPREIFFDSVVVTPGRQARLPP